jgi:asparagine synthase (glutamine-hydrolysing)
MCGIAGFYGKKDDELLRGMTRSLIHRGPDEEGYYSDELASLGMRRLSIVDVEGGHQPMADEDKSIWVVFNGEIYNHKTLRQELEAKGHRFTSRCDTEVIAHLYEELGDGFLHRLRGMFTIALWDIKRRRLLVARDRVGVKPLYYRHISGELFFGSELKCLLPTPGFERHVDAGSVQQYLSNLYVAAPKSIFSEVSKLPPGHVLEFQNGDCRVEAYWDLTFRSDGPASLGESVDAVHASLEESVKVRMESDVPLGAFLSGGLDSSLIVAIMAEHSAAPVKTFTVGFGDESSGYSELPFARKVADAFGTDHHECQVDYNVVDLLPKVLWHFDEPFGNSTAVLTYLLSQFAREHVAVALSGTGGDECFLGYPRYLGLTQGKTYERIPQVVRSQVVERLVARLPQGVGGNFPMDRLAKRLHRFVDGMKLAPDRRYVSWLTYFGQDQRQHLTGQPDTDVPETILRDLFGHHADRSDIDRAFYTDVKAFLPFNQLEYMDKMSMACSLEVRVPFCDHELLELSASMPSKYKLKGLETKRVLKLVGERVLPRGTARRGKVGFDAPTGLWFNNELRPICEALFSKNALRETGNFCPDDVGRLMALHQSGRRDLSLHLWMILVFEVWFRMYVIKGIDQPPNFTLSQLLDEQGLYGAGAGASA